MESDEVVLKRRYYDASKPGSLGGVKALTEAVGLTKKKKKVVNWLSGEDAYTLHKPVRRKFLRRPVLVATLGDQIQADLVDVSAHAQNNEAVRFILTAIDAFSRFAWAIPLKKKTGVEVAQAMRTILDKVSYRLLQTDKGKEFYNRDVESLLRAKKTKHFSTENEDQKASIVERFNRTLRGKIHRIITQNNRGEYLKQLQLIVRGYNKTVHSSTGFKPKDVTYENAHEVWFRLNEQKHGFKKYVKRRKPKLTIGDFVRIAKGKTAFERGFAQRWSLELFIVSRIRTDTNPVVYEVIDTMKEAVKGTFYEQELQKVSEPETYVVEKVIKTRIVRGKTQSFVKWQGYSDAFNSWVSEQDMVAV